MCKIPRTEWMNDSVALQDGVGSMTRKIISKWRHCHPKCCSNQCWVKLKVFIYIIQNTAKWLYFQSYKIRAHSHCKYAQKFEFMYTPEFQNADVTDVKCKLLLSILHCKLTSTFVLLLHVLSLQCRSIYYIYISLLKQ